MPNPQIEKLLVVQDRDATLQKTEQQLARVPHEKTAAEARIKEEEEKLESARRLLQAKEVERKDLENEAGAKENALVRFRNQQLEVKKNDEYRALTHEIEATQAEIGRIEEREIELLMEMDEIGKELEALKAASEEKIAEQRRQIERVREREKNLEGSVREQRNALEQARAEVDARFLEEYDRVRKQAKRPPYVAPIEDHKCGGCHLRVSNEVATGSRDVEDPVFCDQCGRMIYTA
ncbi:MAG: zinc ribbon domain-containing protein [Opitutales bacterium]